MDIIDKYDTQIDAYILDTLNSEQKREFEVQLNANDELKAELAMRRSLNLGLEQIEVKDIRQRLKLIKDARGTQHVDDKKTSNTILPEKQTSNNWIKYLLIIGLSACLAFLALKYLGNSEKTNDSPPLMASYYEPMPLQLSDRGEMTKEIKDLTELYNNKEYAKTIPVLDALLSQKEDVKWNLYRGIAYYETGNHPKAAEDFKKLANSSNFLLSDHGLWYQALNALKMKDVDSAKLLLKQLIEKPSADHAEEAKELLSQL